MKGDLISRAALLEFAHNHVNGTVDCNDIARFPAVDAEPVITGETSDGYHTFNELYHHRAVLFSVIVKAFPERTWKARQHHDGTMYSGMFIVGIDTPEGQASYHYDIDPYWDMFECRELERAPEWDGHTSAQAIERIGRLELEPVRLRIDTAEIDAEKGWHQKLFYCRCGQLIKTEMWNEKYCFGSGTVLKTNVLPKNCPNCGARIDAEVKE